jgi:hypothetical protein
MGDAGPTTWCLPFSARISEKGDNVRRLVLVLALMVPLLVMDAGVAQAAGPVREPLVLEDFVFDGCGFPLDVHTVVNQEYTLTWFDGSGNPTRQLVNGRLVTQFTNLDTSESLTTDTSGPGRFTFFPDGSVTLEGWGNWFNFYDVVPVGAPSAAFLSHGRFMLTIDAAGNVTQNSLVGSVDDLCVILAS